MVHCIAMVHSADGKKHRCTKEAMKKQTFCGTHLKMKTRLGKSRKLSAKKCASKKSPFSKRALSKKGLVRKVVRGACKLRAKKL